MKKILLLITVLFSINSFSQEITYKEYSYAEFFKMIKKEQDSVFKLDNALIIYNKTTDTRFEIDPDTNENKTKVEKLIVDKKIELTNVQFLVNRDYKNSKYYTNGALKNIHFKNDVRFSNVKVMFISDCIFNGEFLFNTTNCDIDKVPVEMSSPFYINIENSFFYNRFRFSSSCEEQSNNQIYIRITKNYLASDEQNLSFNLNLINSTVVDFSENTIQNKGSINLNFEGVNRALHLSENKIIANQSYIAFSSVNRDLDMKNNNLSSPVVLIIDELKTNYTINWQQFENKLATSSLMEYGYEKTNVNLFFVKPKKAKEVILKYVDSVRFYNKDAYTNEISTRGVFYEYYKSKYDTETANEVYLELKDIETKRLEVLYLSNRSFRTYFRWKVNQFLKSFSDYGTDPSKAIVFSFYVILIFAFIYLLFPNSWDSLGKKRLMHRFEFFQKYLRRKEGMHTLYLEDKRQELSSYEDFKNNLEQAHLELPSFFISWSQPLYKASMFSSQVMSRFLQQTDILKGKWQDLTPKQKRWKNIQIGFLLTLGLFYDLFIKVLNALMLSINTFTTLGFGEIPIKGLPRYLAIIQGFIGWFMLTIFSVSLISQLLN